MARQNTNGTHPTTEHGHITCNLEKPIQNVI